MSVSRVDVEHVKGQTHIEVSFTNGMFNVFNEPYEMTDKQVLQYLNDEHGLWADPKNLHSCETKNAPVDIVIGVESVINED